MDEDTKASQAKLCASYNFAGTSDWAVDLQEFVDTGEKEDDYDPNYVATISDHFEDCDSDFISLSQLKNQKSKVPSYLYKDGSDGIDWLHTTVPNTTFTLQDSDGFYKAVAKDSGIEKGWIKFGDIDVKVAHGCQNYPQASDNIEVFNPKDVISKSYDKSKSLLQRLQLLKTIGDLDSQLNWSDLVDAASLPALKMTQVVESMKKVLEEAKKIAKAKREAIIANFIGSILFFISIVSEVAAASSMTAIRAALQMVEAAAEAGLVAYAIVQDPDNAFMTI
ncbi:hypothetical protein QQX98_000945 [Neonectria punicea]|uniref:Uncharacterized protein n=1 Tax=Neonectria punicea TaxID=979145 RepID=A0ABR1HQI6_9HYPO